LSRIEHTANTTLNKIKSKRLIARGKAALFAVNLRDQVYDYVDTGE